MGFNGMVGHMLMHSHYTYTELGIGRQYLVDDCF